MIRSRRAGVPIASFTLDRVRRPAVVGVVSALLLLGVTVRVEQGLYSDPGWQLEAVAQFVAGQSPTPNTLVVADPVDVSRSVNGWISHWNPGLPLLASPFMARGFTVGGTVRLLTAACIVLGAYGWARWIVLFGLPGPLELALAALVPWVHYASNGLFAFSTELLVFGIMPFSLLAALNLAARVSQPERTVVLPALGTGLLLGVAYVFKNSAGLPVSGMLVWLCLAAFQEARSRPAVRTLRPLMGSRGLRLATISVLASVSVMFATSWLNVRMGGQANVVVEQFSTSFNPLAWVQALGAPALMLADLDALLRYILLHPSRSVVTQESLLLFAAPGGVLLIWLLLSGSSVDRPSTLAATVLLVSIVEIAVIWHLSNGVSAEARHVATAGICCLPASLRAVLGRWGRAGTSQRSVLVAFTSLFVIAPLGYSVSAVVLKTWQVQAYHVGPSHVINQQFAGADARACRDGLMATFNPATDIWYLTDPVSALDLEGRAEIVHSDFETLEYLRNRRYRSSRPIRVHALLPPHFESNGKGETIRNTFEGAQAWRPVRVPACSAIEWVADMPGARASGSGPRLDAR